VLSLASDQADGSRTGFISLPPILDSMYVAKK
jgi:hypothetical protein